MILLLTAYFTRGIWLPELDLNVSDGLEDVRVSQRVVDLDLKDNGNQIDGDRIQLLLNGEVILEDHTLTEMDKTITLNLKRGSNDIDIVALNEGSSSPNTAEVAISHVIEGNSVQVSDGLNTGEKAEFSIRAPWW